MYLEILGGSREAVSTVLLRPASVTSYRDDETSPEGRAVAHLPGGRSPLSACL